MPMKTVLFLILSTLTVIAQSEYVTIEVKSHNEYHATNQLTVAAFETAEMVSTTVEPATVYAEAKTSDEWHALKPLLVAGPAQVRIRGLRGAATFRIRPDAYPPDKTLTVAPGTGGASICLEWSTNLVHWSSTTNGVYTNLPVATFFRLKADRL